LEQTVDPHLGRGEGVAPGDDASAIGGAVGLDQGCTDVLRTGQDGLEDEPERETARCIELVDNGLGVLGNSAERLLSIEVLTAG
jgi:hypothetical protein